MPRDAALSCRKSLQESFRLRVLRTVTSSLISKLEYKPLNVVVQITQISFFK